MRLRSLLAIALFWLLPTAAMASGKLQLPLTMQLDTQESCIGGVPVVTTMKLTDAKGTPLSPEMLRVVHTERLHLLVISASLNDYHHLHPKPGKEAGTYEVRFVPGENGAYRLWADITPEGATHTYLHADLGKWPGKLAPADTEILEADYGKMHFTLSLDNPLRVGKASLARVNVSYYNEPFRGLQPVMGAFAHMVGFGEDGDSLLHIHPMGEEPSHSDQRGGPILKFHIMPEKSGFIKLFLQIRGWNQDIFVPFNVQVKPQ